jgi:hypothetical protein
MPSGDGADSLRHVPSERVVASRWVPPLAHETSSLALVGRIRGRPVLADSLASSLMEAGHCAKMGGMSTLEEWMTTVRAELGLDGEAVADVKAVTRVILDLARDAAHGVARSAAPLTAYLVGVAVGQGAPLDDTASRIAALALAQQEGAQQEGSPQSPHKPT